MWHKDQKFVCQRGPDSMIDSSYQAFAGCMDVVNFLLLLLCRSAHAS